MLTIRFQVISSVCFSWEFKTLEFEVVSTENFVGASDVVPIYYIVYIKPFWFFVLDLLYKNLCEGMKKQIFCTKLFFLELLLGVEPCNFAYA